MSNERIIVGKGGMLTYKYDASLVGMSFAFHLFSEVGEIYKSRMEAARARLLANHPLCEIRTLELDAKPWYADHLVRKDAP